MKKKKKITKRRYILGFFAIVALLAIIRLIFPSIVGERFSDQKASKEVGANNNGDEDSLGANKRSQANIVAEKGVDFFNADGSEAEHPLKRRVEL